MIGLAFAVLVILLTVDPAVLVHLDGPAAGRMMIFSPVLSMAAHGLIYSTVQVPMRGPRRYPAGLPGSLFGRFVVGVVGTRALKSSDDSDG